jgi:hypothetical protein
MRLVRELQYVVRPDLFVSPAVYDGQKKLYCLNDLGLAKTGNAVRNVFLHRACMMIYFLYFRSLMYALTQ